MRSVLLALILFAVAGNSTAQDKATWASTVALLQKQLPTNPAGKSQYSIPLCQACNTKLGKDEEIKDKHFTSRIASAISWEHGHINIRNDIYEGGRMKETYAYHVPLTAIVNVRQTNCVLNASANVDAYKDRPVFFSVRKNSTRITHTSYDRNGQPRDDARPRMNEREVDWDSDIPVAVRDWDKGTPAENVLQALSRLAEWNQQRYAKK